MINLIHYAIIIILLFLSLFYQTYAQDRPMTSCRGSKPFKSKDSSCRNFTEICLWNKDPDCDSFIDTCNQCPSNNLAVESNEKMKILLQKLDSLSNKMNNSTSMQNKNINITRIINENFQIKLDQISIKLYLLFISIIILIIILLFEIRYKLITKFFKKCRKLSKKQYYGSIEIRKSQELSSHYENMYNRISELSSHHENLYNTTPEPSNQHENFLKRILEPTIHLENLYNTMPELLNKKLLSKQELYKFQIKEKQLEILINKKDNIVMIKRQICARWMAAKENDYKIMKLKYNGILLDDNDYLLKYIGSNIVVVDCVIGVAINPNDVIVVRLQSDLSLPQLIQINKNEKIVKLKTIINKFENPKYLCFIHKGKELEEESLVGECGLVDDDFIKVVEKYVGDIQFTSIFDNNINITMEYSNNMFVKEIKNELAQNINAKVEDIILFYEYQYLSDENYLYEFDIRGNISIKYCVFKTMDLINIEKDEIKEETNSEIYSATEKYTSKKIFLKKYEIKAAEIKDKKSFLNELTTLLITKSHPRFVQIFNIYKDDHSIYIAMEELSGGSLKDYIKSQHNTPVPDVLIFRWSQQILEGLDCLHKKLIMHRNITTSNILLDNYNNVKLSSFGLSKYFHGYDESYLIKGLDQTIFPQTRYMAPEVCQSEPYGLKADIWSFGAVILEMATGKPPFFKLNERSFLTKLKECGEVPYELSSSTSTKLRRIIGKCLKSDPDLRPTVQELLQY